MCICSRVVVVMCYGDDAPRYQSSWGGKQLSSSRQVLLLKLFEKRSSPRVQRWSIVPGVSVPIPDDLTTGRKGREWPGEGEVAREEASAVCVVVVVVVVAVVVVVVVVWSH
jgi:hypothetical protein